jgi:transposase
LGINKDTMSNWVKVSLEDKEPAAPTGSEASRIAELEKESRELRRANSILRQASAYFAQAGLDRR